MIINFFKKFDCLLRLIFTEIFFYFLEFFLSDIQHIIIEVNPLLFNIIRCQQLLQTSFSLIILAKFDIFQIGWQVDIDEVLNIRSIESREAKKSIFFNTYSRTPSSLWALAFELYRLASFFNDIDFNKVLKILIIKSSSEDICLVSFND